MPGFHYITRPDERERCRCLFLPSVPEESVTDFFTWGRTDERNNRIIILMTLRGVKLEMSTECSTNKPDQLYHASLYPSLSPLGFVPLILLITVYPLLGCFLSVESFAFPSFLFLHFIGFSGAKKGRFKLTKTLGKLTTGKDFRNF